MYAEDIEKKLREYDDMAHTDRAATEVLSLPMHTELTDSQIETIIDPIVSFTTDRAEAGV